ncbi:MAG: insulinase family protein [Pelagimonas sp.]|jgi:zinc protease|nr:insulinase family protein [Pelagimonas sp.]
MRHWLLGAAVCLTPLTAQAEGSDQVTSFALDNGMEVVVIEDYRAPVVEHMVWYRAGSADETRGVSGIAHFLEHLMFKGTETLAPGEFSATVAANGGSDNAFTSYDKTAYHQRIAADRLDLMMQMEAERMHNLRLTEEDVRTEREVIIEERNQRVDNDPAAQMREQLRAAQYLNHPYGTPIIGWRHEMEELDRGDALAFYQQFYAPNNAVLVVVGDVSPEEVKRLAQIHYEPIPANPDLTPRARPSEPPQLAERRIVFADPRVAQPYVMRSYLAPERDPGNQTDAAALTLLAEVLGGGQSSVLTRKLQFESQQAVYAGAWYSGVSLDDSSFGLIIVPTPDQTLEQAEAALDQALAEFISEGVDQAQLDRIKFQIKASQIYARDSASGIARRYGDALTSGLTIKDVQDWPDVLQAVTGDDIIAAAQKVLDRRKSVTAYLTSQESAQ